MPPFTLERYPVADAPAHAASVNDIPVAASGERPKIHLEAVPATVRRRMDMPRHFTTRDVHPFDAIVWVRRDCVLTDAAGRVIFEMRDVEAPDFWSQRAVDIAASKYFRKAGLGGDPNAGERSVKQLVTRVADTIAWEAQQRGYFSADDAAVFGLELTHLLVHQVGAFNSPVWFNCGLWHAHGIATGRGGSWAWDFATRAVAETTNDYQRPSCAACFIQPVGDDLMSIFDLVKSEARLFKHGSGSGTNFSALRSRHESLSSGGKSSGVMSFLDVFDRGAGSIKSGGVTRRAAKLVCLDMDHPEIVDFIEWKAKEERKARALIAAGYEADFNGEAYRTVAGQNSNNSVRVTDDFMRAVAADGPWETRARTTGAVVETHRARALWRKIAQAAWECADPGVQYDTTINAWHTCPVTARINSTNPCAEFNFIDNTACNLASLNLTKFLDLDHDAPRFDVDGFRHAVRTFLVAQEVLVDLSSYPTREIAERSHAFRPLGLGYANLGTLLMRLGLPYDSDDGRGIAGAITALMTGEAYRVSAEVAGAQGAFDGFAANRAPMLDVIARHRAAFVARPCRAGFEATIRDAAAWTWRDAQALGTAHGYRNAQVSVLAPCGTIGFLMDCDTTGVEPDFSLVKYKTLAGRGTMRIPNASLGPALENLGYGLAEVRDILAHVVGHGKLPSTGPFAPHALSLDMAAKIQASLAFSTTLRAAFVQSGAADLYPAASDPETAAAARYVFGVGHVEGAPHLAPEHLAVFDCAARHGDGTREIAPVGHLAMMAAVQPFLSGAISKTVNVPHDYSVEAIEQIYRAGWELGLKAVAIYRDGCKSSQPLATASSGAAKGPSVDPATMPEADARALLAALQARFPAPAATPTRRRLPTRRPGWTQEAVVGGQKIFLRTGEYPDGAVGELFLDVHKEGATFRALVNAFAISVSTGLQYGVPLEIYVAQFTFTRFEPAGAVEGDARVKFATSLLDYVFRSLGVAYCGREDLAHVGASSEPPESAAPSMFPASVSTRPPKPCRDSVFCTTCGNLAVRNGTCYRCEKCGTSMGCS